MGRPNLKPCPDNVPYGLMRRDFVRIFSYSKNGFLQKKSGNTDRDAFAVTTPCDDTMYMDWL